jgi:hypothetical protein
MNSKVSNKMKGNNKHTIIGLAEMNSKNGFKEASFMDKN